MLFKFKSQAASDLIMLEPDARHLLRIMLADDPVKGIIPVDALPVCITALERAVSQDEMLRKHTAESDAAAQSPEKEASEALNPVHLSQRAAPMLKLLKRSLAEKSDVVWGV
jgi:hypothetical protein